MSAAKPLPLNRRQMAWRAAQDIKAGALVNLGMGMPVHVSDYLDAAGDVFTGRSDDVLFKLDGTTGGEIWQIAPPAVLFAVDSNGDLLLGDGTTFWKLSNCMASIPWRR